MNGVYRPPRLTGARAAEFATELRRSREALAEIRHKLEGYDQGGHDDPAANAAKRVADCLPEIDSALFWLAALT